jgi:hypothetical protein
MKKHLCTICSMILVSFLLLFQAGTLLALEARPAGRQREIIVQLADLVTLDEIDKEDQINLKENQINLVNSTNGFQFPLPIPKRIAIEKLILHLDFMHSALLLQNRSQLVVVVNGIIVSQVRLDPQNPHVVADIPVPAEFMREGYNKVELKVSQHYTEECEDPTATELWTQVNTIKSYFYFLYNYRPSRFTLAYLDDLFDKKLIDYELTVMRTKPAADFTDTDLQWGALATEGVSLRLDYKPVTLHMAAAKRKHAVHPEDAKTNGPLPWLDQSELQSDVILLGTRDELAPYCDEHSEQDLTKAIQGPYLGIFPAADPRYQIIVISGINEDDVTMAAQAFTLNRSVFPDHTAMVIRELKFPVIQQNKMPQILQPGVCYTFAELGFKSVTRISHKRIDVKFTVPPDLLAREKATAKFLLDLSYGAGFREDSALNIYLNGLFEKAIYLDNKFGARFEDYEFHIPVASFLPGLNTLSFEPVLPPLVSGKCTVEQNNNTIITIFDSSSIELPLVDHYVRLPDFKLFNRTGFPYTYAANGADMGVVVRGQDRGSILSAWQILAKLTQIASMPLHKAKISFRHIEDRHLFIVGDRKALYEDDLRNAPVQLGKVFEFDYPIDKQSREEEMSIWDKTKFFINPLSPDQKGSLDDVYVNMKFNSYLGKDSLLLGYQSADQPEKLVMLLTNEDPDHLYQATRRLVEPDFWDNMEANLAIWNEDDYSLRTQETEAEFFVGDTSLRNSLGYYYSLHRIQFLLLMGILLVLFAWLAHRWMKRYQQRRNSDAEESDS